MSDGLRPALAGMVTGPVRQASQTPATSVAPLAVAGWPHRDGQQQTATGRLDAQRGQPRCSARRAKGGVRAYRPRARLTADSTARSDAVTVLVSTPTPHRVWPPTSHSTYAAAWASLPADSACSV